MNRIEAFDENFFSFAAMLGSAPGGSLLRFAAPSLAAASGQPYAERITQFSASARGTRM